MKRQRWASGGRSPRPISARRRTVGLWGVGSGAGQPVACSPEALCPTLQLTGQPYVVGKAFHFCQEKPKRYWCPQGRTKISNIHGAVQDSRCWLRTQNDTRL